MNIRNTFSLTKIYLENFFSISGFFEDFKNGPKKVGKNIGIIFAGLYMIAAYGFMLGISMVSMYKGLEPAGMQQIVLLYSAVTAAMITFFFGFLNAATTYVAGSNEDAVRAMPLRAREILTAKYITVFSADAVIGFFIVAVGAAVYGYFEGLLASPLFYISVILSAAAIPASSLFIAYLLLIVILFLFRRIRRKSIITGIAVTLMVVVLMMFSFSFQDLMTHAGDSAYFTASSQTGTLSVISRMGSLFPPASLFANSAADASIGAFILQLTIIVSIFFILLPLIAPLYIRSTDGFNETAVKKLSEDETREFIGRTLRSSKPIKALLIRDIRTVWRESAFFTNGPMIIPLLIAVAAFSIIVGGEEMKQSFSGLAEIISRIQSGPNAENILIYITALVCSLAAVVTGASTSISATSFSREGKAMSYLKALPVRAETIVRAKMIHALIYSAAALALVLPVPAVLVNTGFIILSAGSLAAVYVLIIMLTVSLSVMVHAAGMMIDLKHPKLDWENPIAAFKQNMNSMISVLSNMGLCAVLGTLGFTVLPKHPLTIVVISASAGTAAFCVGRKCLSSAKDKIAQM